MQKIRYGLIVMGALLCLATPAAAEVSIRIGVPHVDIRFRLPVFPELVLIPGLPVYYAPRVTANYFFYDGLYWAYVDDYWYASDWYDGPWWVVEPDYVPLFILRIPVRYYRAPPPYFRGWATHDPPRWGRHWGRDWDRRHRDWDRWERKSAPAPAPLPIYQRDYSGDRYPRARDEDRRQLRDRHYRYQPRDTTVREHIQPRLDRRETLPERRQPQAEPPRRDQRPQVPPQTTPPRRGPEDLRSPPAQRPSPDQRVPQRFDRRQSGSEDREQRPPRLHGKGRKFQERGPDGDRDDKWQERERGRGRD